jgi:outer membrane protein
LYLGTLRLLPDFSCHFFPVAATPEHRIPKGSYSYEGLGRTLFEDEPFSASNNGISLTYSSLYLNKQAIIAKKGGPIMRLMLTMTVWALCISLTLGVWVGHICAEEKDDVLTLNASIFEAIANNWSLRARTQKIEQARAAKNQARAEFLPKVSTRYGYTRNNEERVWRTTLAASEEVAVSSKDNYEWRTTVRQPIFTGFALINSFKLAKLGIDVSTLEFEFSKLDIALKVKEVYFNILIALKAVEVAEQEVRSLESNLKVARSFLKAGMISINDVLKAEVELADAKHKLVKARNAVSSAHAAFNTLLSRPINAAVEVEDVLTYKQEEGDFEEYVTEALEKRPETRILNINYLQADSEKVLARSKIYPEIALTYEYIKEGDEADVSGSTFHDADRWEAMAVATWTFWEWGKTYYAVNEKKALKRELVQTKLSLEDEIRLEVKNALLAMLEAEQNIPTTKKAVEQAEENLRVNEQSYKAQVTTITEVLDAQTLLTRARVNYYQALYDHNLAKARLQRATGKW